MSLRWMACATLLGCAQAPLPQPAASAPVSAIAPQRQGAPPGCIEHCRAKAAQLHDATLRYVTAMLNARQADDLKKEQASSQFDHLCREYPWFAPAFRGLGVVSAMRNAWVPAYVAYRHYLSFDVYVVDRDRVKEEMQLLEGKQPTLALYATAERACESGDWGGAIAALQAVLSQRSSFSLAYERLGYAYAAIHRTAEARAAYRTFLELSMPSPFRTKVQERLEALEQDAPK